jgi:ribosomal protein L2
MLQPRRLLRRPAQSCQCLHTLSRRLYPTEILPPSDIGRATNQTLGVQSHPDQAPEEKNAAILRTYKPRTPGLRHLKRPINDHLYKGRAYLPLTFPRKGQHIGGRNSHTGRITVRHRGAGAKRRIRIIDYQRLEPGKHLVERIEHDPGRSAHIALLSKTFGQTRSYSYIVAPQGMRAGEEVESFRRGIPDNLIRELGGSADAGMIAAKTAFRGNCMPLHMIPPGTIIYNVGLTKGKGAQLCRSAGTFATVVSKNQGDPGKSLYVDVKLKSGEVRRIHRDCCATIGTASNVNFSRRQLGKAGRKRWLGIRPTVRGVAMNASDHPHGGGRGKSKGNVHPVSIWGQLVRSLAQKHLCIC